MPRAFTLIELLVVISIIGLLSSVILASVNTARYSANDARRFSDLRQMEKALDAYYADNGVYPNATGGKYATQCAAPPFAAGLASLASENSLAPALVPTYIPSIPQDPAFTGVGASISCYAYKSNGTDYKFMDYYPAHANFNNSRVSSFIDPAASTQNTQWAVWSAGGSGF